MKLTEATDCGCFAQTTSTNLRLRGSGTNDDPLTMDYVQLGRDSKMSITNQGTIYYNDTVTGLKIPQQLPVLFMRSSVRSSITAFEGVYDTRNVSVGGETSSEPAGTLTTDPEFLPMFDLAGLANGCLTWQPTYLAAGYTAVLEVMGVTLANTLKEDETPGIGSAFDSRGLTLVNASAAGEDTSSVARVQLHMHAANNRTIHAPKIPYHRLPTNGTQGLSWGFTTSVYSIPGVFDPTSVEPTAMMQVMMLWSMVKA